jgi:hypothetical protein
MSHTISRHVKDTLKTLADPQCTDCDGEGFFCVNYNNDPDKDFDAACECTMRSREDAEPDPDGYGWRV